MQRFFKYISSVIIVVFILSSILQFHHHDIDGGVDLLMSNDETCISFNHKCCHIEHSDTHEGHSESEDCCTLKLSTQKRPARQESVDEEYVAAAKFINTLINLNLILYYLSTDHKYPVLAKIGSIVSCSFEIIKLRAPPFFIR